MTTPAETEFAAAANEMRRWPGPAAGARQDGAAQ